jgi:diguanylate cyclase (GGDEF)-like protein/PAS domain S-box-containing protein
LNPHLKSRILIPLILVFLGLAIAFVFTFQLEEKRKNAVLKNDSLTSVEVYYDDSIAARTRKLTILAEGIIEHDDIKQYLKAHDRQALIEALTAKFHSYRNKWRVTHLYFHTVDGVNLVRIHKPEKHGDVIDRYTMKQALKTHETAAGVELGVLGTLTLRVVMPVYLDKILVGFIELGEEVGDIYEIIANKLGISMFLLIDDNLVTTEKPKTAPQFIDIKPEWGMLPNYVIYRFCKCDMPDYLKNILVKGDDQTSFEVEFIFKETHLFGFLPVRDVAGNTIGKLVIDRDVTSMINVSRKSVLIVGLAAFVVWLLICSIVYVILKRFENDWYKNKDDLRKKDASLVNAQRIAGLCGWLWNLTTQRLSCSDEFLELLGINENKAPRKFDDLLDYIHEEDRDRFKRYFANVRSCVEEGELLHRLNAADSQQKWIRHRAMLICGIDEKTEFIEAVAQDVTEQYKAEVQAVSLGRILKYSWNEIYLFDANTLRFTEVSEGALRNLGYSAEEIQQLTPVNIKPLYTEEQFREMILPLRMGFKDYLSFETLHKRKGGDRYPVEVRLQYLPDISPPCYIAIVQDISERKRYIDELEHKALYDALTGLPNRVLFCDRVKEQLKRLRRNNGVFAIVLVDINRLKEVNDTLSYEVGDDIIKQVARRLVEGLRDTDVISHLGGDIFAVMLPIDDSEKIESLLEKMKCNLSLPMSLGSISIDVDVTLGAALSPLHGQDVALLMRCADVALQHAKSEQMESFVYDSDDHHFNMRRLQLISELRTAINNNELEVHYQPKVKGSDGKVISAEALVRWPDSWEGEAIGPSEFVPLAEQIGLIRPLTLLVLEKAIRQCGEWLRGDIDIRIAINLSARNLMDAELADYISKLLQENGVPPGNIILEITETAMMQHPEYAHDVIHRLHRIGLQIAIDDYGTGYSSLVYLKQLPVAELKIDQSFVREMLTNNDDGVIVHSTIELAHNMGVKVVAEGVETREVWDALVQQRCDIIQGYFISRPLDPAHFESWYRGNQGIFDATSATQA